MSKSPDASFAARQRERLEILRDQILDQPSNVSGDDREPQDPYADEVQDSGDEGAAEAHRGLEDALDANARAQLANIQRALEKIDDGSYGISDESGEPIPKERLEAVPEANLTVEEEAERERRAHVGNSPPIT